MRRFLVYFAVNAAVVITISILLNLLGLRPYLHSRGIHYESLLIFCALFGFVGSFISLQISRWSAKRAMGVVLIDPHHPGNSHESRLVHRVQALCTRAGIHTLPEVGIYRSPEVNAFATGPSKDRALIAVSTGLLERMDDQAVEGVLGHEVAHVANGDMVTMALVQGVANTFVMFFARVITHIVDQFMRGDDDEGGGLGFFGYIIVVSVLETALFLIALPVIHGFSRWREYRADAGSARLTSRHTMIHALESLANNPGRAAANDGAIATLKIQGGARGLLAALYSSHPPMEARIRALQSASL